jgi:uncharacterized protein (DUF1919 family)
MSQQGGGGGVVSVETSDEDQKQENNNNIIIWLLKLPFDQNSIIINHKPNSNFNSYVIFLWTQKGLVALSVRSCLSRTSSTFQ